MHLNPEEVSSADLLSRQVFDPPMFPGGTLLAQFFFEFDKNQCESVVWVKKLANGMEGVHRLGCEKQAGARARQMAAGKTPNKTYIGAATAECALIQAFRNPNGHGIRVVHEPSEGVHHVHLCYGSLPDASPMTRSDKNEIKFKLMEIFGDIARHSCP